MSQSDVTPVPDAYTVRLSAIAHSYDGQHAVLEDVELDVSSGEALALLGPSGCGKTTLLRIIAGLERPGRGTVTIGGTVASGRDVWLPPEKRRVGMVFQDWALFPHKSVAENVGYGLQRSQSREARVRDALELVELADFADRMPATLSGGQQQRVALARALVPRPGVLLLDEPFSNLDTSLRVEVRTEVHRLLVETGITSIFVTHDQEEAFVVGDRVAIMREGRIVQVDTPQVIYQRPVDLWVAKFVGTVSTLRGLARGGVFESALGSLRLDSPMDGEVEVVLRPEQLRLVEGGGATVELVEFYGHDAMVFVDVGGQSLRVRCDASVDVSRGDFVDVEFVGDTARAFPLA